MWSKSWVAHSHNSLNFNKPKKCDKDDDTIVDDGTEEYLAEDGGRGYGLKGEYLYTKISNIQLILNPQNKFNRLFLFDFTL